MRTYYYYLTKDDPMTVYFKCKDRTGHTFTSSLSDAMRFNNRNDAINYNHKWLYGECEVVEFESVGGMKRVIKVCIDPHCEEVAHNCPKTDTRCRNCGMILIEIDEKTYRKQFLYNTFQVDYFTGERLTEHVINEIQLDIFNQ